MKPRRRYQSLLRWHRWTLEDARRHRQRSLAGLDQARLVARTVEAQRLECDARLEDDAATTLTALDLRARASMGRALGEATDTAHALLRTAEERHRAAREEVRRALMELRVIERLRERVTAEEQREAARRETAALDEVGAQRDARSILGGRAGCR